MQQRFLCIIALFYLVGFLWSCAHTSPVKQEDLVFKDPEAEKRADRLRKLLVINPNDVEKRIELGRILLSEDMTQEAIIELKRALISDPKRVDASLLLSLAYQKLPNPDLTNALLALKKASQTEPDNDDVHLNLAHVFSKSGNDDMAINEFNKTVELSNHPATLVSAHLDLMAIYKKRHGDLEKADYEYEQARKIYPDIDKLLRQAEINKMTPPPQCPGEECGEGGEHPLYKDRIKQAQEEIKKMLEGEK